MDDEVVRQLIREIEATKGRQTTHEEVSAERYRGIRQTLEELKAQIGHIASRITTDNGRWNKVIRGALVALVLALTSAVVWEAGQLYALEPLRIGATQHR